VVVVVVVAVAVVQQQRRRLFLFLYCRVSFLKTRTLSASQGIVHTEFLPHRRSAEFDITLTIICSPVSSSAPAMA
jgi:hypothetical protein